MGSLHTHSPGGFGHLQSRWAIAVKLGFAAELASDLAPRDRLSRGIRCYLCSIPLNILINVLDKIWKAICCLFQSHELGIGIRDTLANRSIFQSIWNEEGMP